MSGWSPTVTESLAKVWGPEQVGLGHRWSPEMAWAQGTFRQGSALAFSPSSVTLGIPRNFSEPPFAPLWNRNSFWLQWILRQIRRAWAGCRLCHCSCCLFLTSHWPIEKVWCAPPRHWGPLTVFPSPGHFGVVYHGEYIDEDQNRIHCAIKSLSRKWVPIPVVLPPC